MWQTEHYCVLIANREKHVPTLKQYGSSTTFRLMKDISKVQDYFNAIFLGLKAYIYIYIYIFRRT